MTSAIRSMLVVSIYNLTLKPYTDRGKLSIIVVHSFVRDPHIPVAMRFMMVSNISIPQLTLRSISFTFIADHVTYSQSRTAKVVR